MIGSRVTATDCADLCDEGHEVIGTRNQLADRFSNTDRATGAAEKAFGHPA
jgi:hypothetical protein